MSLRIECSCEFTELLIDEGVLAEWDAENRKAVALAVQKLHAALLTKARGEQN